MPKAYLTNMRVLVFLPLYLHSKRQLDAISNCLKKYFIFLDLTSLVHLFHKYVEAEMIDLH